MEHRYHIFTVVLCTFTILKPAYSGRLCLNCQNVPQPLDCSHAVECGSHEECFTDKIVTVDGIVLFNVGCRDINKCRVPAGRSIDGVTLCSVCCNNTDICNMQNYCGAEAFTPNPGQTICFDCQYSVVQPNQCHEITLCGQDQHCSLKVKRNIVNELRYDLGCSSEPDCHMTYSTICCKDRLCNRQQLSQPKFKDPVQNVHHVNYHSSFKFLCDATGTPTPSIVYEFQHRDPFPTNYKKEGNTLVITNYTKQNDGNYHCYATNIVGSVKMNFTLQGI